MIAQLDKNNFAHEVPRSCLGTYNAAPMTQIATYFIVDTHEMEHPESHCAPVYRALTLGHTPTHLTAGQLRRPHVQEGDPRAAGLQVVPLVLGHGVPRALHTRGGGRQRRGKCGTVYSVPARGGTVLLCMGGTLVGVLTNVWT